MKPKGKLNELALQLQEARRRDPGTYVAIGAAAGIPAARVKAIAYGAEPELWERSVLERLARG